MYDILLFISQIYNNVKFVILKSALRKQIKLNNIDFYYSIYSVNYSKVYFIYFVFLFDG